MATEFLRLYRDLTKQDIDKRVEDCAFRKERKSVFTKFGHKVSSSPERVRASKHHGKTARLRQHEAHQKALLTKSGAEIERIRTLRETMTAMDQQYESNLELKALLEQGQPIPNRLYRKLFGATAAGKSKEPSSDNALGIKPRTQSLRCLQTIPRKPAADVKDDASDVPMSRLRLGSGAGAGAGAGTVHKWTRDEMYRLNQIYWEMNIPQPLPVLAQSPCKDHATTTGATDRLPSIRSTKFNSMNSYNHGGQDQARPGSTNVNGNASAELNLAWKNYYATFATRYQLFFPRRKTHDIIAKVQECLRAHRFKEPGEKQYWESPERLLPGR